MSPKIVVILYKSKVLSNDEHPLMLRVTQNEQRKYVSLGSSCPEKLWDNKKNLPKRTHPNRKFIQALISQKVLAYQNKLLENQHLGRSTATIIDTVDF